MASDDDDDDDLEAQLFERELRFVADSTANGVRLDAFLTGNMRWRSRTSVQKLIDEKKVTLTRRGVPQSPVKAKTIVLEGDVANVALPKPKRDLEFSGSGGADELKVLFEDRWLLAVDKPPNVAVHPAGRNMYRTVITALKLHYLRTGDPDQDITPKLCHRLDLETSGVLLVAKDDAAHRIVSQMFREREPEKEYLAITHGVPQPRAALIDRAIGPAIGRKVSMKKWVRDDTDSADVQEARTEYEVVSTHGGDRFALVKLRLLTGRHHQIRVHCASIGHPLVGDKIYGDDEEIFIRYYEDRMTPEDEAKLMLPRQALHAHRLKIPHPITGAPLEITAPLPEDLAAFLRGAG